MAEKNVIKGGAPAETNSALSQVVGAAMGGQVWTPADPQASAAAVNTPVPTGFKRLQIVAPEHTDGRTDTTYLRDSVIDVNERAANYLLSIKAAFETDAPLKPLIKNTRVGR